MNEQSSAKSTAWSLKKSIKKPPYKTSAETPRRRGFLSDSAPARRGRRSYLRFAGPLPSRRLTLALLPRRLPAFGSSRRTLPFFFLVDVMYVSFPTRQCRALIFAFAVASFAPITFGTTHGGLNGGGGGGGGGGGPAPPHPPTALQALRRPPVATCPLSPAIGSTPPRIALTSCATVSLGCAALTSAATPATCGVAIEVPLIVL